MTATPRIRAAVATDAPAIHALHMAAIEAIGETHYSAEQRRAWRGGRTPQQYLEPIATRVMRVALAANDGAPAPDSALLGFAQLDLSSGAIEAIYVQPGAQRAGIGTQLLRALESSASVAGAQDLWLDASLNAVAFYAGQGFEALSAHEYPVGGHLTMPCVRMRKRLRA